MGATDEAYQPAILIVDDQEELARSFAQALAFKGFRTAWTTDPTRAADLAREFGPDLALVDLVMPVMNGWEVIAALEAVDPSIRCVIVTARGTVPRCRAAFLSGVRDFVEKPVTIDELDAAVRRSLEEEAPSTLSPEQCAREARRRRLVAASLEADGHPKAMARILGCSVSNVYKQVHKYNVPSRIRSRKPRRKRW